MIEPSQHLPEGATSWLDMSAMLVFVLHVLGVALPHILTGLTIVWLALRIVEASAYAWTISRTAPRPAT
jgi:hypothetical protein